MIKKTNKNEENSKIKGEYNLFNINPSLDKNTLEYTKTVIRQYVKKKIDKDQIDILIKKGYIKDHKYKTNIIPTIGRNVIARLLANDQTYSGAVDYGALGDGVSPVFTNSSVQLVNEIYRSQADSQAWDENIAYIDWFIASGDVADGTYSEFGSFIDGTITPNSGIAFSLLATGGWVKSGSLFISAKYTIL
jgi:hypothetical protein